MFGPHVNRAFVRGDLARQLEAARDHGREQGVGLRCFQVFVAGPRNMRHTLTRAEVETVRAFCAAPDETGAPPRVYAHGTYMDVPWSGRSYTRHFILDEAENCCAAGIRGLVLHLGRPDHEVTAEQTRVLVAALKSRGLARTALGDPFRIYLEVPHVLPKNSLYDTPEKLGRFFARLSEVCPDFREHVGLCVDTAHLWSCGVDLRTAEGAGAWLEAFEAERRLGRLRGVDVFCHLNDSFDLQGSGLDHHAPLGEGNIWGAKQAGPSASSPAREKAAETPKEEDGGVTPGSPGGPAAVGLALWLDYAAGQSLPCVLERKDPDPKVKDPRAVLARDYGVIAGLQPSFRLADSKDE